MMKNNTRNYLILACLLGVFIAPGITAFLFYQNPQWVGAKSTNKGQLIAPPIMLNDLGQEKKWHIILWNPHACEKTCLQEIDRLARVRLAMGRRLYNVNVWLMLDESAPLLTKENTKKLAQEAILVKRLSKVMSQTLKRLYPNEQIFIADKDNYLILAYTLDAKSADIFHDVKQLLTNAEK